MEFPKIPMNIIVAMDSYGGIGKCGDIPWDLPEDRCRLHYLTTMTVDPAKKNVVLMGRNVWESFPANTRPLTNRINVVLSETLDDPADGSYIVAHSFQNALDIINSMPDKVETIWNIGGHNPFEQGLKSDQLSKLFITYVDGDFDADIFFPPIDFDRFMEEHDIESYYKHCYRGVTYSYGKYIAVVRDYDDDEF